MKRYWMEFDTIGEYEDQITGGWDQVGGKATIDLYSVAGVSHVIDIENDRMYDDRTSLTTDSGVEFIVAKNYHYMHQLITGLPND